MIDAPGGVRSALLCRIGASLQAGGGCPHATSIPSPLSHCLGQAGVTRRERREMTGKGETQIQGEVVTIGIPEQGHLLEIPLQHTRACSHLLAMGQGLSDTP